MPYTIDDMLTATLEQKPSDFEAAFDDVITNIIRDRIHDQKIQIAQQMYGYEVPEEEEEPTEEELEQDDVEEEPEESEEETQEEE
jgi:hypothetical protein